MRVRGGYDSPSYPSVWWNRNYFIQSWGFRFIDEICVGFRRSYNYQRYKQVDFGRLPRVNHCLWTPTANTESRWLWRWRTRWWIKRKHKFALL
jgi:hypothetical protein